MGTIAKYALGLAIWPILSIYIIKQRFVWWPAAWTMLGIVKASHIIIHLFSGENWVPLAHDVPLYLILGLWTQYQVQKNYGKRLF